VASDEPDTAVTFRPSRSGCHIPAVAIVVVRRRYITMQPPLVVDVAVIGGGLAGLTAATTAATAGARLALVEARSIGGRARSIGRDGFILNEGPHALSRGAGGWAVLEALGVRPRGATPPGDAYRVVWDGEIARLPTGARSILTSRLLGLRSKAKLAGWFGDIAGTAAAAGDVSLDEWLDAHRARPDLHRYITTMGRLVTYSPRPGVLPAGTVLGQFAAGTVAYLHGGWQQLVDGLAVAARNAGAQLIEHEPVLSVTPTDRRWTVATTDHEIVARSIVLAAGGPQLAATLIGDDPAAWVDRAGPVQRAACLDVGGERGAVDFLLSADDPLYLSLHAPLADLAPDGQHLYSVMRYLAPDDLLDAHENRAALERHAATAGLPGAGDRSVDRYLAAPTVTWGSPQVGVERPTGLELAGRGVLAAGDWVGTALLGDASIVSGATAGAAAVRHAMVAA
jgi:glycine/D-amino acid oxidase-like deaminating enzyme